MKNNLVRAVLLIGSLAIAWMVSACSALPTTSAQSAPNAAPTAIATATPVANTTPDARANAQPNARGNGAQPGKGGKQNEALARLGVEIGAVNQISADSLAIKTRADAQTFALNSNTLYVLPGKAAAQARDFKTGDRVLVKKSDDAANTALLVLQMPANFSPDSLMLAQVDSVASGSLALKTKAGSQTLTTNANTVVVELTAQQAKLGTLSDLTSGVVVIALGSSKDANATA
ncbi:MAG: hypothetical protein HY257_08330, partial [Chloroflexi bacterium]|nr:hypothetical protein [Chloroflexota bacterium]